MNKTVFALLAASAVSAAAVDKQNKNKNEKKDMKKMDDMEMDMGNMRGINNINVGENFIINNGKMSSMGMKDCDDRKGRRGGKGEKMDMHTMKWAVAQWMDCGHMMWNQETDKRGFSKLADEEGYEFTGMVGEEKYYDTTEEMFGRAFMECIMIPMMKYDMEDHEDEIADFDEDDREDLDWMDEEGYEEMMDEMDSDDMDDDDDDDDDMDDDMPETDGEPMM